MNESEVIAKDRSQFLQKDLGGGWLDAGGWIEGF